MQSRRTLLKEAIRIDRACPENLVDDDSVDYTGETPYETYDSFLREVGSVSVSSDSVIFRNGVVDVESLYLPAQRLYFQTRYLAKKLLLGKKVRLDVSRKYLLATDQESVGHFHWLTEVLPRLWLVRDRAKEFVLLLPDHPYVRTVGVESLELLGFDFADIVWMKSDALFKVPDLYHLTKVSRTGRMHDEVMKELRDAFVGGKAVGEGKLYVSRMAMARRKVLNDNELIALLRRYGFDIFTGEGVTLREQIELFSRCKTVIGIHGAGLANCLFMHPGTVVELKKREPNHGYWHLAAALDHRYYYYNGVPDSNESLIGSGCNLTIPVDDFEQKILREI